MRKYPAIAARMDQELAVVSAAYNNDTLKHQSNPSKLGLDNFFSKKIKNEFFQSLTRFNGKAFRFFCFRYNERKK